MRVCSRACTKSHACTIIIHARRCAARLCARRISPQNLAARRGQHNVRFIFTFTSLAFCQSSCVYIYICIYIHTWLLRFSVFFLFFPPLSLPVSIRLQASAFETASLSLSISYSLTIHVQEPYLYYIAASSFVFLRFLSRLLFPSRYSRRQKKKNYACPRALLACSPPSLPRELSSLAKEKFAKCP